VQTANVYTMFSDILLVGTVAIDGDHDFRSNFILHEFFIYQCHMVF